MFLHQLLKTSVLLMGVVASTMAQKEAGSDVDYEYRWTSTGGGWRAMFACIGFSNVFQQAEILNDRGSRFSAISTTSGSTWFSTQLFYSNAFFDKTVMAQTPNELYDFTVQWMNAYYGLMPEDTPDINDQANFTSLQPDNSNNSTDESDKVESVVDLLFDVFEVISTFNGDWAEFVNRMLETGAETYGHQGDFSSIIANKANRLAPLQNTDLVIQTALDPTARVRMASMDSPPETNTFFGYDVGSLLEKFGINATAQDWVTYIGPFNQRANGNDNKDEWDYYSVPISAWYIVNESYTGFQYATYDSNSSSDVSTFVSATSPDFTFEDYRTYHLFPPPNDANVVLSASKMLSSNYMLFGGERVSNMTMTSTGTMSRPFGGTAEPTVIQLAAMSSAAAGLASPASPSVFSQALSQHRHNVLESTGLLALVAFDLAVNEIYQSSFWDHVAVCSQWPKPCGPNEGYLIDGVFVDNPALATNIAEYQHGANANLSKTLRIILTNTNQDFNDTDKLVQFFQYFDTDFNEGISPGGYMWPPGMHLPIRSPQVFQERLDLEGLRAKVEPLKGSNMTTALLKGTTVNNPSLGIMEGQSVEILMINLNEPISTLVVGSSAIGELTIPLAKMTKGIASNQDLVARVRNFIPPMVLAEQGTSPSRGNDESIVATSGSLTFLGGYWALATSFFVLL